MKAIVKTGEKVGFEFKTDYPKTPPSGDECQIKIKVFRILLCSKKSEIFKKTTPFLGG